jgi:hypothetical protein
MAEMMAIGVLCASLSSLVTFAFVWDRAFVAGVNWATRRGGEHERT